MTWLVGILLFGVAHGVEAADFDERLVEMVGELEPAAHALIIAIAYVLGVCAFGSGLFRLMRTSEDRWRAPSGTGTVLCFVAGTAMFSFPALLTSAELSLFGAGGGASSLSYGGADSERYDALLQALFAIVQIIGLVSFLKGWFVLRTAADGHGRATMGSGAWHIVGGLLAWHIVPVLAAVQETTGIELLRAG